MIRKYIAGAIALVAIVVFAWTLVHALYYAPESEQTDVDLGANVVLLSTSSQPVRLQIPSLHIDALVQHVGITKTGNMGIPSNFTDVAWYKYGPTPGQLGSAVIDGHVDNGLGLPGVFKKLGDLLPGDDVYVISQDGQRLHFVVKDLQSYIYNQAPNEFIFNRKDRARLNLITCEGTWLKAGRTYDRRLVVYTELVSS